MCRSKKDKDIVPKSFDEFTILRELDRRKLHSRYICSMLGAVVIWFIATGTAKNEMFPDWVSFASTITSIVLSVLAIILSITGEGKTEYIKEQIIEAVKQISESQKKVDEIHKNIEDNVQTLRNEVKELGKRVEEVPQKTAQQVKTYYEENKAVKKSQSTGRTFKDWEKK